MMTETQFNFYDGLLVRSYLKIIWQHSMTSLCLFVFRKLLMSNKMNYSDKHTAVTQLNARLENENDVQAILITLRQLKRLT